MSTPAAAVQERNRCLRTAGDIAAAGAEAVKGWRLTDKQCDQLAACLADITPEAQPDREST